MVRTAVAIAAGRAVRLVRPGAGFSGLIANNPLRQITSTSMKYASRAASVQTIRSLSTARPLCKGLSPETDNPQPKVPESSTTASGPAELSVEQYNQLSDQYLDALVNKLEQLQEESEEGDVEYEYSAGVLTITVPDRTYVINKQPPNKQIWLSSPISGPKRYDFVIASEGQDAKEGTGSGLWVYTRDGSTLDSLLEEEIGVDMSDPYASVPHLDE